MAKAGTKRTPKKIADPKARFLARFAKYGAVISAADAAGVGRTTVYGWLEKDPEFKASFEEAKARYLERLEAEVDRRAFKGCRTLKFADGQAVIDPATGNPYEELKFSDTLAIVRLKALDPDKYREITETKHSGEVGIKRIVGVDVEKI